MLKLQYTLAVVLAALAMSSHALPGRRQLNRSESPTALTIAAPQDADKEQVAPSASWGHPEKRYAYGNSFFPSSAPDLDRSQSLLGSSGVVESKPQSPKRSRRKSAVQPDVRFAWTDHLAAATTNELPELIRTVFPLGYTVDPSLDNRPIFPLHRTRDLSVLMDEAGQTVFNIFADPMRFDLNNRAAPPHRPGSKVKRPECTSTQSSINGIESWRYTCELGDRREPWVYDVEAMTNNANLFSSEFNWPWHVLANDNRSLNNKFWNSVGPAVHIKGAATCTMKKRGKVVFQASGTVRRNDRTIERQVTIVADC